MGYRSPGCAGQSCEARFDVFTLDTHGKPSVVAVISRRRYVDSAGGLELRGEHLGQMLFVGSAHDQTIPAVSKMFAARGTALWARA